MQIIIIGSLLLFVVNFMQMLLVSADIEHLNNRPRSINCTAIREDRVYRIIMHNDVNMTMYSRDVDNGSLYFGQFNSTDNQFLFRVSNLSTVKHRDDNYVQAIISTYSTPVRCMIIDTDRTHCPLIRIRSLTRSSTICTLTLWHDNINKYVIVNDGIVEFNSRKTPEMFEFVEYDLSLMMTTTTASTTTTIRPRTVTTMTTTIAESPSTPSTPSTTTTTTTTTTTSIEAACMSYDSVAIIAFILLLIVLAIILLVFWLYRRGQLVQTEEEDKQQKDDAEKIASKPDDQVNSFKSDGDGETRVPVASTMDTNNDAADGKTDAATPTTNNYTDDVVDHRFLPSSFIATDSMKKPKPQQGDIKSVYIEKGQARSIYVDKSS